MCGGDGGVLNQIGNVASDIGGGIGDFFGSAGSAIGDAGKSAYNALDQFGTGIENFVGDNPWLLPAAGAAMLPFTFGGSAPFMGLGGAAEGAGAVGELAGAEMAPSLFGDYALGSATLGGAAGGSGSSMIPIMMDGVGAGMGAGAGAGGGGLEGLMGATGSWNPGSVADYWSGMGEGGIGSAVSDAAGAAGGGLLNNMYASNNDLYATDALSPKEEAAYAAQQASGGGNAASNIAEAKQLSDGSLPGYATGTPNIPNQATSGSGIMDFLKNYKTPLMLGGGLLSNFMGKSAQAGQTQSNLQDYMNATTWTPQKSAAYQSGVAQNTAGTAGAAGARAKGTVAEQLAGAGRGGGKYGQSVAAIDEGVLNQIAQAKNQALTTTSTPPNLAAAPFMSQSNATADTLTGLGGMFGNMATQGASMDFLKKILPKLFQE